MLSLVLISLLIFLVESETALSVSELRQNYGQGFYSLLKEAMDCQCELMNLKIFTHFREYQIQRRKKL